MILHSSDLYFGDQVDDMQSFAGPSDHGFDEVFDARCDDTI